MILEVHSIKVCWVDADVRILFNSWLMPCCLFGKRAVYTSKIIECYKLKEVRKILLISLFFLI